MKEEERKAGLSSKEERPPSPKPKEPKEQQKTLTNFGTAGKSQHAQTHMGVFFNTVLWFVHLQGCSLN